MMYWYVFRAVLDLPRKDIRERKDTLQAPLSSIYAYRSHIPSATPSTLRIKGTGNVATNKACSSLWSISSSLVARLPDLMLLRLDLFAETLRGLVLSPVDVLIELILLGDDRLLVLDLVLVPD